MTIITKITPGSFTAAGTYTVQYDVVGLADVRVPINVRTSPARLSDDAAGSVYLTETSGARVLFGTINYDTGEVQLENRVILTDAKRFDPYGPYVIQGQSYKWDEFANTHPAIGVSRTLHVNSWGAGTAGDISGGTVPTLPPTAPPVDVTLTNLLASVTVDTLYAKAFTQDGYTLKGVSFGLGTDTYAQATNGTLFRNQSPTTGIGTPAGSVSGPLGAAFISLWTAGISPTLLDWRGLVAPPTVGATTPFTAYSTVFRTAATPLRTSSLSVLGTMQDGTTFNVTADGSGRISGTRVKGRVDYQYGLVELYFVDPAGDSALNVDLSFLGISGLTTIPADLVRTNSVRYNAVAFSYLPLDAALLGIDPVRLPSDGRVPIFRTGGFAVVGHTGAVTATVANAQVIDCARVRLSRVRVIGNNGVVINTGYTADLEAGTVTFTDVTGYSQPVTVEHRIEDMGVVREIQINGAVTFTRALTHDYPVGSFVSSALVPGDLKSRVSILFDQATWNGTSWLDAVSGSAAPATYNDILAPLIVTNQGAVTERWALRFTNTTTYDVIGEHVGTIATGTTSVDCAPINPATGVPYFTIPAVGWGTGWAVGNTLRFNTVGALFPVWMVRTIQQGPESVVDDKFTILVRGDVDRP